MASTSVLCWRRTSRYVESRFFHCFHRVRRLTSSRLPLLSEQIINAVQLYDRYAKPTELDSDEEAIEEAKALAAAQGLEVPPSATPHDRNAASPPASPIADNDDAQSISSRLSAFEMQDREVDKLQRTQRRRLERHLSSRQQVPTLGNMHPDLQDLAFGPTASG